MLELNTKIWGGICDANRWVNGHVRYRTDMAGYRREEFWVTAERYGDCEDFALAKRKMLLEMGIPLEALMLATCRTELGEGHAVLLVATTNGVFVLDNRHKDPKPWKSLGYNWHSRQVPGQSTWELIND